MRMIRCATCHSPFGLIDIGVTDRETVTVQATLPLETLHRIGVKQFTAIATAEFYDVLREKLIAAIGDNPGDTPQYS